MQNMIVLQETHAGPVPGMHSVESVEAEQRRLVIDFFSVTILINYITEAAQLRTWGEA